MLRFILVSLIILVVLAGVSLAGIPKLINYQGMLTDNSGTPLSGSYNLTFKIWTDTTGGSSLWDETHSVQVQNGLYNVTLGIMTVLNLPFDQQYWLEVQVGDETMPRLKLTSVAYAYRAEDAEQVKGISACAIPQANSLFPLGSDAKFPAEVIPSGLPPGPHDHIGEQWSGVIPWSNGAFKVTNSSNGPSIWGVNTGGGNALRGNGFGSSNGLYAESESVTAIIGRGQRGWGMEVYGKDDSYSDRSGDLMIGGTYGEIFSFGSMLDIYSDGYIVIDLDDNNNDNNSDFAIVNGSDNAVFHVYENGNMWASGTKSAMVQTANHGQRLLYAMESPEVWFEDFGKAALVNGEATVAFEYTFTEAANLQVEYHVFLTPLCQEPILLFVTAKGANSFTVRGVTLNGQLSDCAFDYRVVAKRLGYEQVRLESVSAKDIKKGSRGE